MLLFLSTIWRLWFLAPTGEPQEGAMKAELPMQHPAETLDTAETTRVTLSYRDIGERDHPILVLIHGSPLASAAWNRVIDQLAQDYRLIIPDLPGFGGSTRSLPDYSFAAHGAYVLDLLDILGITRAHWVAYSMGGGVALSAAEKDPERLASLTLLSCIGLQEHELLGDYAMNRALHGLQLGIIWGAQNLLPHFGWLDDFPLNLSYARNFFDSDQRPLRGVLERLAAPVLILHGTEDPFVPPAAARAHARLLPQAEVKWLSPGHLHLFTDPDEVVEPLVDFIQRVESNQAQTREAAMANFGKSHPTPHPAATSEELRGIALLTILVLLALTTLVTEDLACIAAGLLVANGSLPFVPAATACFLGILIGDLLLYGAGRLLGEPALRRRPLRWVISPRAVVRGKRLFAQKGAIIILSSRFLPGTRAATYFASGVLKAPFFKFLGLFVLASALWTPALVYAASLVGAPLMDYYESFAEYALPALLLSALLLTGFFHLVLPLFTWRGRRLLLGRWLRWTRWEHWPLLLVNAPVFLYVLFLGYIRYRRPTLFTITNPAVRPDSGFIGERKSAIFRECQSAHPAIARWELIPADQNPENRVALLDKFLQREQLTYPVVLKPDEGQRGLGVRIIRNEEQARQILQHTPVDLIVQEFIPGNEFGIFYIRFPGEMEGRLLSLTEKRLLAVTGDGESSLERLILAHPRAVHRAKFYLQKLTEERDRVPTVGEIIPLVEIGTHAMGALFLDAGEHATTELRQALDKLLAPTDGFHFGRLDLRVPKIEDLRAGKNIKILEINALTSEATHIYDPRHNLLYALRTLCGQWRTAFQIADANARRGHHPMPSIAFLKHWRHSFLRQRKILAALPR